MTLSSSRAFRPPEIPNTRRRNGKYPCLLDVDCVADVKQGKGKAGIWTLGKAVGMTLSSSRAFRPPEIPNTRRRNGKYPCLLDVDCIAGVERGNGKAGIWAIGMALGMTLSPPRASRPPEISFPFLFERPQLRLFHVYIFCCPFSSYRCEYLGRNSVMTNVNYGFNDLRTTR